MLLVAQLQDPPEMQCFTVTFGGTISLRPGYSVSKSVLQVHYARVELEHDPTS